MAYYYIKLYHEILDDPKMGLLPDHLWRRVIELFLIASDSTGRDGYLPDVDAIAWKLRASHDEILADLQAIEPSGIICQQNGRWYVTNFVKRQAAVSDAERVKRYRERERDSNEQSNEPVTDRNIELELKIESESENRGTSAAAAAVFQAYTREINMITPMIRDAILDELKDNTPAEWIVEAIKEASKNNARNWAYVAAILRRWKVEGKTSRKRGGAGQPADYSGWGGADNDMLEDPPPSTEENYWTRAIKVMDVKEPLLGTLKETEYISWDGSTVTVKAPGASKMLESRLGSLAKRTLTGIIGQQVDKVIFTEA